MSDAIQGVIARYSSLVDGTIRYTIDVSPADDNRDFHNVNASVAIALLSADEPAHNR